VTLTNQADGWFIYLRCDQQECAMPILTPAMKRMLDEQRLGFVATVCPDGTPNLSPKGTTAAWDDDHLVFADIHSPGTIANLRHNPHVEVNVVDPFARKGYRFKGSAEVLTEGAQYDAIMSFYRQRGSRAVIHAIVLIQISAAAPLISPAYDDGTPEADIRRRWEQHYAELHQQWATSMESASEA
jgi:predicted pyridoxine 5'-phosphate oxidase superfamily flavin-nucleotide-binding protein